MDVDFYNLLSVIRGKFWGLDDSQIEDLIVSQTANYSKRITCKNDVSINS